MWVEVEINTEIEKERKIVWGEKERYTEIEE